mmetsp:Transcript_50143/g.106757  ORF Transcript_50143/g.106757 Transcript_50143/m.106757 type:complete len:216 (-) Transcript_50143:65-712(-)
MSPTRISPFLATIFGVGKQVGFFEALRRHPVLVVASVDAVQFVGQVGEPARRLARVGAPDAFRLGRRVTAMFVRAGEVDGPRGRMGVLAFLEALVGTSVMLLAALLGGTVDLEIVRLVHLGQTVARVSIGIPRAVPTLDAAGPWIRVDGVPARMVALFVIVQADANGTVAAARPRIENAPSAIGPGIVAPLRRVRRGRFARLTRRLPGWTGRGLT